VNRKASKFLQLTNHSHILCAPEKQVYDCFQFNKSIDKADMNQIAKAVRMSTMQVRAAILLLMHKGLIKSEDIIDGEITKRE
jgi:predicted DNA-binding transcriptional regulator